MVEYSFNYPKGMWLSTSTSAPEGYASDLINLVPRPHGLQLRKGNKIIDYGRHSGRKYTFIASFVSYQSLILFSANGIYAYNPESKGLEVIHMGEVGEAINFSEQRDYLIIFFKSSNPMKISKGERGDWQYSELNIRPNNSYSGVVRYRERLYFYKEGSNALYYGEALALEGDLRSFDVTSIFNTNGTLVWANVLGYMVGVGM